MAAREIAVGLAFALIGDPPGGVTGRRGLHAFLADRFVETAVEKSRSFRAWTIG